MEQITITGAKENAQYLTYLYEKVRGKFSFSTEECGISAGGGFETLSFCVDETLCPYLRRYAEDRMAEIIAVGYKYRYFDKRLSLPLLSSAQKQLLCTALVAADFNEDREYAVKRLRNEGEYSIDGVFNFRLGELKRRWDGVLDYIPAQFGGAALDDFVSFLVDEGEGKAYVKGGRVYDENYRLLSRSKLLSGGGVVAELLLKGAAKVYCFGETETDVKEFLLKYYRENAVFC